jgi:hypothetical protein
MTLRLLTVLATTAVALTAGPARAGYEFTFDSSNYTVAVGQTVTVSLYLTQTGGTTSLSTAGLASGGAQLNYNSTYLNNSSITPNNTNYSSTASGSNTGFDPSNNVTRTSSGSSVLTVAQSGTEAAVTPPSGNPNSILLGTFQFTGVSAGTSLTLTSQAFPGSDVNVLGNGTVIDSLIQNSSAVITVTAVPEPGSLILGGLAVTGIAGTWVRRRRTPATA